MSHRIECQDGEHHTFTLERDKLLSSGPCDCDEPPLVSRLIVSGTTAELVEAGITPAE